MSEVRHIEIIEAETDSEGNFLKTIDEENDDEEIGEIMFVDDDEYEFITQDNIDCERLDSTSSLACDICDRKFNSIENRNAHIEDHFKSITCPGCERSFVGDRAFEFHLSAGKCKTIVDKFRFPCNVCNIKVFESKEQLDDHLLNEHQCVVADGHLSCVACNKTFSKLKYMKKHVKEVHEKATIFKCSVCNKVFNRKANLIEHQLIHDGKYLAKCEECGNSYRTLSALKLHKRTHTGEKPYRCDITLSDSTPCEKSYAYNTDLKRHKRSVHGIIDKVFHCEIFGCGRVFYENKLLNNHLKKFHPVDTDQSKLNSKNKN